MALDTQEVPSPAPHTLPRRSLAPHLLWAGARGCGRAARERNARLLRPCQRVPFPWATWMWKLFILLGREQRGWMLQEPQASVGQSGALGDEQKLQQEFRLTVRGGFGNWRNPRPRSGLVMAIRPGRGSSWLAAQPSASSAAGQSWTVVTHIPRAGTQPHAPAPATPSRSCWEWGSLSFLA